MTLIKSSPEERTILDFSKGEISKNMIKSALRSAEVLEHIKSENSFTWIDNYIKIGMYQISLQFYERNLVNSRRKLREYGSFDIVISERYRGDNAIIDRNKDVRFKSQYWIKNHKLRMKDLVDVIMFIKRLNNLKAFL
jgi:hypothetical protein